MPLPPSRRPVLAALVLSCALTAATLTTTTSPATAADATTTYGADATTLGAIPDGPPVDASCQSAAAPGVRDVSIPVAGISTPISRVVVAMTMRHGYVGNLGITLIAPDGRSVPLIDRPGKTPEVPCGDASGIGSTQQAVDANLSFADSYSPSLNTYVAGLSSTQYFRAGTFYPATRLGTRVSLTSAFASLGTAANGVWKLRFVDYSQGELGQVTAASLTLSTVAKSATAACQSAKQDVQIVAVQVKTLKKRLPKNKAALKKVQRHGSRGQVATAKKKVRKTKAALTAAKARRASVKATYNAACL